MPEVVLTGAKRIKRKSAVPPAKQIRLMRLDVSPENLSPNVESSEKLRINKPQSKVSSKRASP